MNTMRTDWDDRAQENWQKAILSRDVSDVEFWQSGEHLFATSIVRHLGEQRRLAVEIGCGAGRVMRPVARHFDRVVGFDVSPRMVEIGREHNPGFDIRLVENEQLAGIADGEADLVYAFAVFQHIPDGAVIKRYMQDAARVLGQGGVFTCTVLTRSGWSRFAGVPLPRMATTFLPRSLRRWRRRLHGTRADRTSETWHGGVAFFPFRLRRLLMGQGFSSVEILPTHRSHLVQVVATR